MLVLLNNSVDLILCDVQMPEIDGFQFIEYIKEFDEYKDIPIIFITGTYHKDQHKKKGYKLGAIEYISKPIEEELLSSKLKVYIDLFNKNKKSKDSLENAKKLVIHNTKMASVGEMIGVISHQLKQPLNILSLYCSDIKFSYDSNSLDEKSVEEFSTNTRKQIHYMRDTIDSFLSFFKPNKEKSVFYIKKALQNSIKLIDSNINKNKVELTLNIENNFGILGIEMELSQVIMNLITNSIEAFQDREVEDRKMEISAYNKNNKNYIEVSDNAGGIQEPNLEKIFDPYFTTKSTGTGIGLYMVKLVINDSFHGKLSLENSNIGVKFIMEFETI
jgi:two-component system, sensor histidine kinase and response regulator